MLGVRPLNKTELEILDLCFMRERSRVFFKVCLYTGLRPQEALSLKVSDVRGQVRLILAKRYSKGKVRSRSVLLHPALVSLLEQFTQGRPLEEPLFMARAGKPLTYQMALREFKEAAFRAGLKGKVGLHSGRKTFAGHAYDSLKKDIFKTARILGHADVKSTMAYLSFSTEEADAVVDAIPWAR